MEAVHKSIQETRRLLATARTYALYSDTLTERILRVMNEDALTQSHKIGKGDPSALENMRAAWAYASDNFTGRLSHHFITEIAGRIFPDNGFKYREVRLGRERPGRPAGDLYLYCSPEKIGERMEELLDYVATSPNDPILKAADFHFAYVTIQPMKQAHKRTARFLQNLYLLHQGIPPALIPYAERNTYYALLAAAQEAYKDRVAFGKLRYDSVRSPAEQHFLEYLVDKTKAGAEEHGAIVKAQKMYRIDADIRGSSKRGVDALRNVLKRTFRAHGVIAEIIPNYEAEQLLVVSSVPEELIIGALYKNKPAYVKSVTVSDVSKG